VLAQGHVSMKDADYADFERGLVGALGNDELYLHGTDELIAYYGMAPTPGRVGKAESVVALAARHDTVHAFPCLTVGCGSAWGRRGHVAVLEIVSRAGVGNP
jgi:hypothetical protein